jgi:UTP--glucose-1-phosphate uridylyltransferase
LTPDIFDDLDALTPGSTGELQLTDALAAQATREPLWGVISSVGRRDIGSPWGWLQAVVEAAADHAEYGAAFREWLATEVGRRG